MSLSWLSLWGVKWSEVLIKSGQNSECVDATQSPAKVLKTYLCDKECLYLKDVKASICLLDIYTPQFLTFFSDPLLFSL